MYDPSVLRCTQPSDLIDEKSAVGTFKIVDEERTNSLFESGWNSSCRIGPTQIIKLLPFVTARLSRLRCGTNKFRGYPGIALSRNLSKLLLFSLVTLHEPPVVHDSRSDEGAVLKSSGLSSVLPKGRAESIPLSKMSDSSSWEVDVEGNFPLHKAVVEGMHAASYRSAKAYAYFPSDA